MSDDPVIRFAESESEVRAAWGGMAIELRDGVMRLFEPSAGRSGSSVRQVTL